MYRNIINSLLSFTNKSGRSINFEAALKYPLSPVSLSIANADGRKRKTNKAKLKEIICKYGGTEEDVALGIEKDGYVLDMITRIRNMSEILRRLMVCLLFNCFLSSCRCQPLLFKV